MTSEADLRRLTARIATAADIFEARLPHATASLNLAAADGYPARASGTAAPTGGAELTPTEGAAHTNLGDLFGYDDAHGYRPGPAIRLDDIADELRAALTSLDRAHSQLTDCGVPPFLTRGYQCHGINGTGCTDWADKNRADHLCIDCGRAADSNSRRLRRRREAS